MSLNTCPLGECTSTPETCSCIKSKYSDLILDANGINSSVLIRTNNIKSMYIDKYANVGINTTSPGAQLEIVSSNGYCTRLRYGETNNYADIIIDDYGKLKIMPIGGEIFTPSIIRVDNTINASSTTGSIITAGGISIQQDAYIGGTVIANIPIPSISGGNGFNTYDSGDILTGSNTGSLIKLHAPTQSGYLLSSNSNSGTYWGYKYLTDYIIVFPKVIINSSSSYTLGPFYGKDSTGIKDIALTTETTINLTSFGINGIGLSSINPMGLIYPNPISTTITGVDTIFTSDVNTGVIITCNGQTRRVISVINNLSINIDIPFTILNAWTLGDTGSLDTTDGTMKFGIASFNGNASTSAYALLTIGSNNTKYTSSNANLWTLEFWINIKTRSSQIICISNATKAFKLSLANTGLMSIYLGQGSTFNIANGLSITGSLVAGTYSHVAIVFTGISYVIYVNGIAGRTITSSLAVSQTCFDSFRIGSDGSTAFNGHIDEFRLSNISRYNANFIPQSSEFVLDSNTMSLNHFNNTSSITQSDDLSSMIPNDEFSYTIDTSIYPNTVYYGYCISDDNTSQAYVFNSSYVKPQMPSIYTTYARIPFYAMTDRLNNWIAINYSGSRSINGSYYSLMTPTTIIENATNTISSILNISLLGIVPNNTTKLVLLISHTHVGNITAGISIGHYANGMMTTLLTTAVAGIYQLQYTLPIITQSIDTFITASASTTNYSIQLCGFYT